MKKAILAILLFSCGFQANSQVNSSIEEMSVKFEKPDNNNLYVFATGVLFTALGANGLLQENKTNDQKFQNYSAIGLGVTLIGGSVAFDIGDQKKRKKIIDP